MAEERLGWKDLALVSALALEQQQVLAVEVSAWLHLEGHTE